MAQERRTLLSFYEAALHAYRGERELWARNLEEVMKEDPANPYYGSIIIGSALGESRRPANHCASVLLQEQFEDSAYDLIGRSGDHDQEKHG